MIWQVHNLQFTLFKFQNLRRYKVVFLLTLPSAIAPYFITSLNTSLFRILNTEGGGGRELQEMVWANGGYMQPALQEYEQFENVARGYKARLPDFRDGLEGVAELEGVALDSIGKRL